MRDDGRAQRRRCGAAGRALAGTIALALGLALEPAAASGADGVPLCAVPVAAGGDPTVPRLPLISGVEIIPDLPLPILRSAGATYTIDERLRLVPYPHALPASRFAEGAGGRVVGIEAGRPMVAEPGSRRFGPVALPDAAGLVREALFVPRQARSILIGHGPLLALDGARAVWLDPPRSTPSGPYPPVQDGVRQLVDLPAHAALAVVAEDGALWLRRDGGSWLPLGAPPSALPDQRWTVHELTGPARLVVAVGPDLGVVETHGTGAALRFDKLRWLPPGWRRGAASSPLPTPATIVLVRSDRDGSPRVERLDGDRFVPVPGGDLPGVAAADTGAVAARGWILFQTGRSRLDNLGLHLFDGERVVAIPDSDRRHVGLPGRLIDIPMLGMVLLTSQNGLFELAADKTLRRLPLPVRETGWRDPVVIPLAEIGRVLVLHEGALFELTADRAVRPVALPDAMRAIPPDFDRPGGGVTPDRHPVRAVVAFPPTGAAILLSHRGLHALDRSGTLQPIPGGERLDVRPFRNPAHRGVLSMIPGRDALLIDTGGVSPPTLVVAADALPDGRCPAERR